MQYLGHSLRQPDGSQVSTADAVANKSVVGLYFSAHWCPPCQAFTPLLCQRYKQLKEAGHDFEIVFVSGDNTFEEFADYHSTMVFPALLPALPSTYSRLTKKLGVWSIPTLIFMDTATGAIIMRKGRNAISQPSFLEDFPFRKSKSEWRTQLCGLVSCQVAIQSYLHPGSWLWGVRNAHSEEERWLIPDTRSSDVIKILEDFVLSDSTKYNIARRTLTELVVDVITPVRWLDQLRLEFRDVEGGSECHAVGCSTGFLPLIVPLAPLLNALLCWVPFGDSGKNFTSLLELRRELSSNGKQVNCSTLRASCTRRASDEDSSLTSLVKQDQ